MGTPSDPPITQSSDKRSRKPREQQSQRSRRRAGAPPVHASTAAASKPNLPATPVGGASQFALAQTFMELAPDAMVVADTAGHIIQVNHQTEVLFGYARSDLLGRPVELLIPTRFHPHHHQHRADYAAAPHTRPMGVGLELFGLRADGSEFPVEVSLSPFWLGDDLLIISSVRDITVRKRAEAAERAAHLAISRQRALLQRILNELPGGAYVVRGPEARLVLANRAAEEVWGAHWREGQPLAEFLETAGIRYFAENGEPLLLEDLATLEVMRDPSQGVRQRRQIIRRPDGSRLPILLNAVPIEEMLLDDPEETSLEHVAEASHTDHMAALVVLQDISAIAATEQLKDEFVSMAAHELRTPLSAVAGFANMLSYQTAQGRGPELADWQREAIEEIETATARLNMLVNDLLDATRIQAGRLELHMVPLDLVAAVRRALNRLRLTTTRHTLILDMPDTPLLLAADGLRLEQVLGNLVGNAIKYSPDGGPITVTIQGNLAAGEAEVRIQDTGIGIPIEEQANLFQRFSRASNVHDYQIPGSGLGLYVCRELVERHGGHLWFESVAGQGTTFFLRLPTLRPEQAPSVHNERRAPRNEKVTAPERVDHPPSGMGPLPDTAAAERSPTEMDSVHELHSVTVLRDERTHLGSAS